MGVQQADIRPVLFHVICFSQGKPWFSIYLLVTSGDQTGQPVDLFIYRGFKLVFSWEYYLQMGDIPLPCLLLEGM